MSERKSKTERHNYPADPAYPCVVVTEEGGALRIQIIGTALLLPGRYQLIREANDE